MGSLCCTYYNSPHNLSNNRTIKNMFTEIEMNVVHLFHQRLYTPMDVKLISVTVSKLVLHLWIIIVNIYE